MIYREGDHIIYSVSGDLFYAIITETQRSPHMVRIVTLFSLIDIEFDDKNRDPSKPSYLSIKYIKTIIPSKLSKKEIIETYPEYMI